MVDENQNLNRRKYPRKSFRKSVAYMSKGFSEVVEGVEIGEGGISFRSEMVLDLNQYLIVDFFLPSGDFFSVRGVVRNSYKDSKKIVYGVSFEEVSTTLNRKIRAYVARNSVISLQ